jgi:hypothetical protein
MRLPRYSLPCGLSDANAEASVETKTSTQVSDARLIERELLVLDVREFIYGGEPTTAPFAAFEHELHESLRNIILQAATEEISPKPLPAIVIDPGFVLKAAMEIADGHPPNWLVDGLTKATWEMARGIKADVNYHGRPEFRSRIKKVRKAAWRLRNHGLIVAALDDLIRRIGEALSDIPARQGRAKFYPSVGVDPVEDMEFCAHLVKETWALVRESEPGKRNLSAQRACQFLWQAAGGPLGKRRASVTAASFSTDDYWVHVHIDPDMVPPPTKPYRWEIYKAGRLTPLKVSPESFDKYSVAKSAGKEARSEFLHELAAKSGCTENNRRWEVYLNAAKQPERRCKGAAIRAVFFFRQTKASDLEETKLDPERAKRLYANTSPVEPRDLIGLWPTRQRAADAIGEPIEVINGWISGTVAWDHTVIRRLHDCIDQAAPLRPGIVSVRSALENAPVD